MAWIIVLVTTWGVLLYATSPRQFAAFWTAGLWSIALAALGEGLIRRSVDVFPPEALLVPLLGTEFLNFIGPRFVEGVLYMQTMEPLGRIARTVLWVIGVVFGEMLLVITSGGTITWQGTGLALAVHTLRFLSLLGLFYGLGYYERHRSFAAQRQRQLVARIHRILWPLSWPILWAGAGLFARLSAIGQRTNRR